MEPVIWESEPPELRSPALICAFAGWNDAASAATAALEAVAASLDPEVVARIDPEEFYDFQVNRPTIRLVEGQSREIDWPANTLLSVEVPTAERDLALLSGVEPNVRWRTFADSIVDAARRLDVEIVITLGALIADVAHTRPVPITGLASDPDLVERLGLSRSSYEGPTGIVGVLHDACRRHDLVSASLWAAVPHYVAAVPNPKAALALLRRLEGLTGIAVEASELEDATGALRGAGGPRRIRQPGDRGAGSKSRGDPGGEPRARAGRVRRRHRAGVPALPAPARHGRGLGSRHRVHALAQILGREHTSEGPAGPGS